MFEVKSWLGLVIVIVIVSVVALLVALAASAVLKVIARKREWPRTMSATLRVPFRVLLFVLGLWVAVALAWPEEEWLPTVVHTLVILTIAASAWFAGALISFGLGLAMTRLDLDVKDNRVARRRQTQLTLVRRLLIAIVAACGLGAILLTFPAVAALGTSILASAGVAGIVAGLAAQSTLASVFAGIQLAFSEAIRVDDVVVVEGEWGRIQEITLTYVVVHIWDDRRLVLPSTYFTTTPFENWTRRSSELLGSVELDLDWQVSPSGAREELERILTRTELWDGRVQNVQVTDAVGGAVRLRVLVSAVDGPTLWDLRCFVREELVDWIQRQRSSIPATRVMLVDAPTGPPPTHRSDGQGGLFSGSADAEQRAEQFTAAVPIITPEQAREDAGRERR